MYASFPWTVLPCSDKAPLGERYSPDRLRFQLTESLWNRELAGIGKIGQLTDIESFGASVSGQSSRPSQTELLNIWSFLKTCGYCNESVTPSCSMLKGEHEGVWVAVEELRPSI